MHGNAGDLAVDDLALSGVDTGSHLDSEFPHRLDDRARTRDRACGAVEASEESVAGRVDLDTTETEKLAPYGRMVLREQLAPAAIAELGGARLHRRCQ